MTRFPTAGHLASWAGLCPGNDESAGKRRSGRIRKGSKWLSIALTEAAQSNTRTKDTDLASQYRRIKARRGHHKAIGAVQHSIIIACWHMLATGELYNELGGDYFSRRDPQRQIKRLVAQLERLGQQVTCNPPPLNPKRAFPSDLNATLARAPLRGVIPTLLRRARSRSPEAPRG